MSERLRPVEFYVLLVLADGQAHGYSMIQKIEERTEGDVRLQPGTLYRALDRLLGERLVRLAPDSVDAVSTQRKVYVITESGRVAARREAQRMRRLVDQADASGLLPEHDS